MVPVDHIFKSTRIKSSDTSNYLVCVSANLLIIFKLKFTLYFCRGGFEDRGSGDEEPSSDEVDALVSKGQGHEEQVGRGRPTEGEEGDREVNGLFRQNFKGTGNWTAAGIDLMPKYRYRYCENFHFISCKPIFPRPGPSSVQTLAE